MKVLRITNKITNRETASFKQYLNEIADIKMFTPEEEAECSIKATNGDKQAIEELVKRNLRFVVSIAKQYETPYINLEDLVNEGNIGLIMAAEKYNVTTGFKFITYAVFWVRKMILEFLAKNGRIVRLPSNKINGLTKFNQQVSELEQKHGRSVDISEVVTELSENMSEDEVMELGTISAMKFDSFDSFVGDSESSNNLYEMIADNSSNPTDYLVADADLKKQISGILSTLKPRDKKIIISLYGLDGSTPLTLKEVGENLGLTREMIRQIKEKSIKALRKVYIG